VTFKQPEMVNNVQMNRPHRINGIKVETKRAVPREDMGKDEAFGENIKKIFVGGLRDDIEDKDLEDYFGAFGSVISIEQVSLPQDIEWKLNHHPPTPGDHLSFSLQNFPSAI
jgi:RNA recognition motif-containing protein